MEKRQAEQIKHTKSSRTRIPSNQTASSLIQNINKIKRETENEKIARSTVQNDKKLRALTSILPETPNTTPNN
jgi:hypothetical protein